MTETIELPVQELFDHAVALMRERIDTFEEWVDDEIEYSLSDISDYDAYTVEECNGHNLYIFHCHIDGSVTKRIERATRWNPPEYEREPVPILIDLTLDLRGNAGLGCIDVVVDNEGNPFEPSPSYDPYTEV